jgi:hypothetical protein
MGKMKTVWGMTVLLASASFAAEPSSPQAQMQAIQSSVLKETFQEFRMGPIERKWFEVEIAPEGGAFVSNYKNTPDGPQVEVDRTKLKNYLRFTPRLFVGASSDESGGSNPAAPTVCVTVKPALDCQACQVIGVKLEELYIARLKRRGFSAIPGPRTASESPLTPERAAEEYTLRANEAGCTHNLYSELVKESTPDTDDHSDDTTVRVTSYLNLREASAGKRLKSKGQAVLQAPGNPQGATVAQLATTALNRTTADMFAGGTTQVEAAPVRFAKEERYLRLENVREASTVEIFKRSIQTHVPEIKIEERFISPGRFEFAVIGQMNMSELAKRFKEVPFSDGDDVRNLNIVSQNAGELAVELK